MLITSLPLEIQNRIFTELYWAERRNTPGAVHRVSMALKSNEPLPVLYEQDTEWRDGDLRRNPSLFPHTTASVCRLWRSILSGTSRYWTRFVLDLDDPYRLPYRVFGWSRSRLMDVVIISRPQASSEDEKKKLESERVLAAFKALIPYTPSCKSIIFDVRYSSSLPSPDSFLLSGNPHLKALVLESQIDDVTPLVSLDIVPQTTFFKKLADMQELGLHGATFMDISKADPTWLEGLPDPGSYTHLSLSHLECSSKDESPYTISRLVRHLSTCRNISYIAFRNVRLVGQPEASPNTEEIEEIEVGPSVLTFEKVDAGFICEFMDRVFSDCDYMECIGFSGCEIPITPSLRVDNIILVDICDSQSLKNALQNHDGSEITLTSCAGFDDDLLDWLANNLHCPRLRGLAIHQCEKFTVGRLRAFMRTRKRAIPNISRKPDTSIGSDSDLDSEEIGQIRRLSVRSAGIKLTGEDEDWFKDYMEGYGYIDWVEGDYTLNYRQPASAQGFYFD